ncbi:hypothetical protein [Archangium violaceum]|uniref:Uncharacterized protein n=1 Tax=Archangium violaceum Cb vi76 TaxID=1406225 RepID=A0A084T075_9BACT|nr:hypothetical protein [Archangium violaceum]KFA94110.1 hypothetical protein Q664_04890 [Archangium violaceum Cb vi76]
MGFLKFLVWTGCAVGLGVFLAIGEIDGRTPMEYAQREWKRHVQPAKVERVKGELREALDDAKETVTRTTKQAAAAPRERITNEDRAAIDKIIAQKK